MSESPAIAVITTKQTREVYKVLDEQIIEGELLTSTGPSIFRRFRDSTAVFQVSGFQRSKSYAGGLELLGEVEFSNDKTKTDHKQPIGFNRRQQSGQLEQSQRRSASLETPKEPLSDLYLRRFLVQTPVEILVERPQEQKKLIINDSWCQTEQQNVEKLDMVQPNFTTNKKEKYERNDPSSRKASTDRELIYPNNQQYERIGEQSPLKELEMLRQKLEETETRLSEQNAYLRQHIGLLHQEMGELKEDVSFYEGELTKAEGERNQLARLVERLQPKKSCHVGVTTTISQQASESVTVSSSSTKQELSEQYINLLKANHDLERRLGQMKINNQTLCSNVQDREQELYAQREAFNALNYNISAHLKEISELNSYLNEEKQRSEKLFDRNCELAELLSALQGKHDTAIREKQRLEFEVDNSEEMKRAVFKDLQQLSQRNKQLQIDNDALRSEIKVLHEQNSELMESSQEESVSFVKLQQLSTERHLLRIELEESRGLLELMKQERNMIELQAAEEARIKDQIIKEVQGKQRELQARIKIMEGRITEQDKIINRVASIHQLKEGSEDKQLEQYRSLTKTLSGENVRLKEELRRARSKEDFNQPPQNMENGQQAQNAAEQKDLSVHSEQGSSNRRFTEFEIAKLKKSGSSLAQQGLEMVENIKKLNSQGLSEQTVQQLIELAEHMAHELSELQLRNKQMRQALDKLSRVAAERQRAKMQLSTQAVSTHNLTNEDEKLFERVVTELEKEKQANLELTASIEGLSRELLQAEREIFKKAEKINYLNIALVGKGQEQLSEGKEVENLKKYLHHSNNLEHFSRKARSNIIDQQYPRGYRGNLEKFARKVVVNESEDEHQRSNPSQKLEKRLLAYSTSLVPDLQRELDKYKRLYDDAMFAFKERDAQAKELQADLTILKTKYLSLEKGLHPHQLPPRYEGAYRIHDQATCQPLRTSFHVADRERSPEPVSQFSSDSKHIKLSELMKNHSVTHKTLLLILQQLSETCLKLARYGSIPMLQIDNIYVLGYDPLDPSRLRVKLVDVEMSHRMLHLLRSKPQNRKYIAPENVQQGSLITLQSLVWNIGVVLEEALEIKRKESLRESFDPQLRKQRNQQEQQYQTLLRDLVVNLKAGTPSQRLSLGRLQYRLQQQLNRQRHSQQELEQGVAQ